MTGEMLIGQPVQLVRFGDNQPPRAAVITGYRAEDDRYDVRAFSSAEDQRQRRMAADMSIENVQLWTDDTKPLRGRYYARLPDTSESDKKSAKKAK